ncbi:hypothetical protein KFE25_012534 [Diacronema lutheri]|uniref:GB1/RHD3-type G domain-containing protein n=1 Tax=Diacronema lutheri TaxID=2081491 RepID=A0A8J6CBJ7_DIALT|nr:hypothetical protein KFE25_012534 [Diacronema lutheri]
MARAEVAPFVRHDGTGWRVCDEGASLLGAVHEPVVVIAIAGLYRTGKSFLLNCIIGATGATPALPVGSTSESCTRGIDVCVTPTRLANGARLVLLDTEGLASMEQDEAYDAQVFALALLLSSYFVLNSMGVLDEAAIDRLYLISELSKHVCVRTDTAGAMRPAGVDGAEPNGADGAAAEADLAQFFPPLLLVLRDFVVELVSDGHAISADEYMDKALQPRPTSARRADERNRVRAAIRTLFPRRACVTLVRPAADENAVRHAASLPLSELREEFVHGMRHIQTLLLGPLGGGATGGGEDGGNGGSGNGPTAGAGSAGGAPIKSLFGQALTGAHLARLAQQYARALNTEGVVPSIRGAWEYVVADACREAKDAALRAHGARLARALDGEEPDGERGARLTEPTELLLAVAQPSGVAARATFRRAAIAGADADLTLAQLEADLLEADARAAASLTDRSRELCDAAADRLCGALEATLGEAAATAGAPPPPPPASSDGGGDGGGVKPLDGRARARDELPRAMREFAARYADEACGPAKAGVLAQAMRGRVAAAVEGAARALDGAARDALAASASERAQLELRAGAAEALLRERSASLDVATAERTAARAEADELRAQLARLLEQLADARAARAASEAEAAAGARASAAELAAARAELDGERARASALLAAGEAELARETARGADARRLADAQLASAREQLGDARAEVERTTERLASAQREGEAALTAARAAGEGAVAECHALRSQLAALTAQIEAGNQLRGVAEAQAARDAQAAAQRHAAELARAASSGAELAAAERLGLAVLVAELRSLDGWGAGVTAALRQSEEERSSLALQLADFHERLAVLPEFYVQQIFCAERKPTDLLDALAPDSGGSGDRRLEELAEAQLGKIKDVVSRRFAGWFGAARDGAPAGDEEEYTAEQVMRDMQAERAASQRAEAPPPAPLSRTYGPLA